MARLNAVRPGDLVRCDVMGDEFYATVVAVEKAAPRVVELDLRLLPAYRSPHRRGARYERVRARAVKDSYRRRTA